MLSMFNPSFTSFRVNRRDLFTNDTLVSYQPSVTTNVQVLGEMLMGSQNLATTEFDGTTGLVVEPSVNSNSLTYELPYYHPTRYAEMHAVNTAQVNFNYFNGLAQSHALYTRRIAQNGGEAVRISFVDTYVAAAEDSSFFFFIGFPPWVDVPAAGLT